MGTTSRSSRLATGARAGSRSSPSAALPGPTVPIHDVAGEHSEFRKQAGMLSAHQILSKRGSIDLIDAAMTALTKATTLQSEGALYDLAAQAMDEAAIRRDDIFRDDEAELDWRMGDGLMGPD